MPEPLKNYIDAAFVSALAGALRKADPKFDSAGFQKTIFDKDWKNRELKQRIRHVSAALNLYLPYPYRKQLTLLLKIAPAFTGLGALVFPDFVEVYGLEDIDASLDALEELTRYSTGEFAIRPLIGKSQEKVMKRMKQWAQHPNEHVRRLASEGCRPRLPWASPLPGFKKNPQPVLEILSLLKQDPSEYVRRSVANNLNDIAKDNPKMVLQTAQKWIGSSAETDRLIKHACRTLLRQGEPEALALFGFSKNTKASVSNLKAEKSRIRIGETLAFSFHLHNESKQKQNLRVEYVVYFLKNNGKHSKKVFQHSTRDFPSGKTLLGKKHRFMNFTTRKHYPGEHHIAIAVNGVEKAKTKFHLEA